MRLYRRWARFVDRLERPEGVLIPTDYEITLFVRRPGHILGRPVYTICDPRPQVGNLSGARRAPTAWISRLASGAPRIPQGLTCHQATMCSLESSWRPPIRRWYGSSSSCQRRCDECAQGRIPRGIVGPVSGEQGMPATNETKRQTQPKRTINQFSNHTK
jgi:hypothetical protein